MITAEQFAALGDDTRCALIDLLRDGPRPVQDLASAFAVSRPAISRHLGVLRRAGLLLEHRRGRQNLYSIDRTKLRALSAWLELYWGPRIKEATGPSEPSPQLELDL